MRSSQNKGTGPSRKSTMRRSYARYKDTDTAIGLAGVSPSSAAVVSRVSEDEMELNKDYEKSLGGIHVTRTIAIE